VTLAIELNNNEELSEGKDNLGERKWKRSINLMLRQVLTQE